MQCQTLPDNPNASFCVSWPGLLPKSGRAHAPTFPNRSLSQQTHCRSKLWTPAIGNSKVTFHSGFNDLLTAWVTDRASSSITTKNCRKVCVSNHFPLFAGFMTDSKALQGRLFHSCPSPPGFGPARSNWLAHRAEQTILTRPKAYSQNCRLQYENRPWLLLKASPDG